jgi:UDP-2-acetamido-3-amino-2,3-dideoxy-glucuronate N-acetyltransferase
MRSYRYGNRLTYYEPCNIYDTAKIGLDCKVGMFSEIGHNVEIGDNVVIGAHCFIPENVFIEDGAWIGPGVFFSNDKYPPSSREKWGKTVVRKGAVIGMRSTILSGIEIGEGAFVGAGSVVTKNIPAGERWCGVPADKMGVRKDGDNDSKDH